MATARMGRPSLPSPGTRGVTSDGTQVHGRETPLHCSILSFLIQNVCVSLVRFFFFKPFCHLWVTLGVREGTGKSHQVATYCWRLVLCPFLWGLVLWVSPRVGAQVKAGHTMLYVSVGAL